MELLLERRPPSLLLSVLPTLSLSLNPFRLLIPFHSLSCFSPSPLSSLMTPTIFCDRAVAAFKGIPNVKIDAFDEDWARSQNMNTFLSVTNGTAEPAKFLQIKYTGAKDPNAPTLAFVGKGITFDSGGISIKGGAGMKLMRADMLGELKLMQTKDEKVWRERGGTKLWDVSSEESLSNLYSGVETHLNCLALLPC